MGNKIVSPFEFGIELLHEQGIEEERSQGVDARTNAWLARMNDLPGRLIFLVAILAGDIEPQEIGGRFSKEVGS